MERDSIDAWIAAHDTDVERYNADVNAYWKKVEQWEKDYEMWRQNYLQLILDVEAYNENPDEYTQDEIDALNARIDEINAIFNSLEDRRIAIDEEYNRLQDWSEHIADDQEAIVDAVNDLNIRTEENNTALNDANSQKKEIEKALNNIPPITDIQISEFEWLIQEEMRLAGLEHELETQKDSIETDIENLNHQKEDASSREELYLEQIKDFVQEVNLSIKFKELRDIELDADRLLQDIEDANRAEKVREMLDEILLGPDEIDHFSGRINEDITLIPYNTLNKNEVFMDKWKFQKKDVSGFSVPKSQNIIKKIVGINPHVRKLDKIFKKNIKIVNETKILKSFPKLKESLHERIKNKRQYLRKCHTWLPIEPQD